MRRTARIPHATMSSVPHATRKRFRSDHSINHEIMLPGGAIPSPADRRSCAPAAVSRLYLRSTAQHFCAKVGITNLEAGLNPLRLGGRPGKAVACHRTFEDCDVRSLPSPLDGKREIRTRVLQGRNAWRRAFRSLAAESWESPSIAQAVHRSAASPVFSIEAASSCKLFAP